MPPSVKVTAPFRKLIQQLASAFYSGDCPPKTPEELAIAAQPKNSKAKQAALQSTVGLGPITLAALSSTTDPSTGLPVEWIKEDELADMINMHPKILRKALRYLEQEQLLAREHRMESQRTRKKAAAAAQRAATAAGGGPPPAAQLPDLLQGEAVATEGELPPKVLTFSYCCIDWPSVVNVARLRLHKAQAELKDKLSDKHAIQKYRCPTCGRLFTSLDVFELPRNRTHDFLCEACHERHGMESSLEVVYEGDGGDIVTAEEQRQRKSRYLKLKSELDSSLKPMIQHLERVARLPVPDFGPLADWAAIRSAELRHRQHRARHGVQRDADGRLDDEFADETAVHVDMEERQQCTHIRTSANPGQSGPCACGLEVTRQPVSQTRPGMEGAEPAAAVEAVTAKALPPWLRAKQAAQQAAAQATSVTPAASDGAPDAAASGSAEDAGIQKAYQAEFMKRIQAAMAAKAAARGQPLDQKDKADILNLKAEVKAEAGVFGEPAAKRVKLEDGGFAAVKPEEDDMVSIEMEHAKAEDAPGEAAPGAESDEEWEDI